MEQKPNAMPNIRPASDFRTQFTDVLKDIYGADEPVFFTRKGRCDLVAMSTETFKKYELTSQALYDEYKKKPIRAKPPATANGKGLLLCSFCGKTQDDVERMIIGPGVNICNECTALCFSLTNDDGEPEAEEKSKGE